MRGRSRLVLTGCAVVAMAVVLAACGSSSSGSASSASRSSAGSASRAATGTASRAATGSPYQIGVMADLTGPAATLGVPQMAGITFWADQTNASGGINGHRVTLVRCDSQGTAQGGVACAARLASLPVVVATSLIAPDEAALPSLTGSLVLATTPLLVPARAAHPNTFQTEPTIAQSDGLALAAAHRSGIHTVGVVATDDATGTVAVKALQSEAAANGVTLAVQYVPESVTSATVQLAQLQADHAGMIFVATPGSPAAAVVQAYKSLGLQVPLVLTSADVTDAFLQSVRSADLSSLYGVPAAAVVPGSLPEPYRSILQRLFSTYQNQTGKAMDYATLLGYYTGQLAGDVIGGAGYHAGLPALEKYVETHHLATDLGPLSFPGPTNVESGISPVVVQMAPGKTSFEPCRPTASFRC